MREQTALHHTDGALHALAEPIFWIAAVLCVVAELAILRSAFTPQNTAAGSDSVPHSPHATEMMWAIIPAIGLALLLGATWRAIH